MKALYALAVPFIFVVLWNLCHWGIKDIVYAPFDRGFISATIALFSTIIFVLIALQEDFL